MLTIGGFVFLLLCVFGSYIASGGHIEIILEALPFELLTIGGAAAGTFAMANTNSTLKHVMKEMKKVFSGPQYKRQDYEDLLCLLFQLLRVAKTKGAVGLEPHIEKPEESAAFTAYSNLLHDHFAVSLICDTLRMVTMNKDDPHQVEDMMSHELKKFQTHRLHLAHALQLVADALPALGIVAAVLGVVKTMASITQPPSVLGEMIGGALVGTFLGVLLAYGLVGPMASKMKSVFEEEIKFYEVIQAVLVAHLHGHAPQVSVETGRKAIPEDYMPSFAEVETLSSGLAPIS